MTKKILAMFLAVLMVVSMLPTSVFAVEAETDPCPGKDAKHTIENCKDYQILGLVDATCTTEGGTQARCNHCGVVFMLHVDSEAGSGEHNWGEEVAEVKATCKKDGVKAYKVCEDCRKIGYYNDKGEWTVVEAAKKDEALKIEHNDKSHVYVDQNPEITCENHDKNAKKKFVCSECGDSYEEKITQDAHTWNNDNVELWKDEDGNVIGLILTCTHCGATKKANAVDDHDCNCALVQHEEIAATCTEEGRKAYEQCPECGKYFIAGKEVKAEDLVIAKVAHTFDNSKLNCKTTTAICTVCHLEVDAETVKAYINKSIPQNGHKVDTIKYTCKDGQTLKCATCEAELLPEDVDFTRPTHKEFKDYKSCTDTTKECRACGDKVALTDKEKTGHNWVGADGKATNVCTDNNAKCSICGITGESLGYGDGSHTWGEWGQDPDNKPTCTEKGDLIRTCSVCGNKQTKPDAVAELKHDVKYIEVAGNCVDKSYKVGYCVRPGCTAEAKWSETKDKVTYDWSNVLLPGLTYEIKYLLMSEYGDLVFGDHEDEYYANYDAVRWTAEACDDGYCLYIEFEGEKCYLVVEESFYGLAFTIYGTEDFCSVITVENGVMLIDGKAYSADPYWGEVSLVEKENWATSDLLSLTRVGGEFHFVELIVGETDADNHKNIITVEDETHDATCLTNSVLVKKCDACGTKFDAVIGDNDKLNHKKENKDKELVDAWVTITADDLDALNDYLSTEYTAEDIEIAATCQKAGQRLVKCALCNAHYACLTVELAEGEEGHNWSTAKPVASHNDAIAYWTAHCTNNGCTATKEAEKIYWDNYGKNYDSLEAAEADGHAVSKDQKENKATCTADGNGSFYCDICKQTVTYTIAKTGHSWTIGTDGILTGEPVTPENYYKAPSCTNTGYEYSYKCNNNGCTEKHEVKNVAMGNYKTLETVEHNYVEWEYYGDNPAKCDKVDYLNLYKVCAYDDCVWSDVYNYYTEAEQNIIASKWGTKNKDGGLKHFIVDTVKVLEKTDADLCKEYNYEVYACPCGEFHVRNLIGNFGHQWIVKQDSIESATCITYGKHDEYCGLCNKDANPEADGYKANVIDPKLTEHINSDGVKFTEKCNDKTENRKCVLCKETVKKLHTLTETEHKATCETALYYSYECADCDYTARGEYIGEPTGHKAPEGFEKPEANYEENQNWSYICENCGKEKSGTVEKLSGLHMVLDAEAYTCGSLITVTVRLDNVEEAINAYQFGVCFDWYALCYVGYKDLTNGEFISEATDPDVVYGTSYGTVNVSGIYDGAGNYEINGSQDLVELYFRVGVNGNYDDVNLVGLNNNYGFWAENEKAKIRDNTVDVEIDVNNNYVKADLRELGDFNGVYGLTINDIKQALPLITKEGYSVQMDVNFDGKFDAEDVRLLLAVVNAENQDEAILELIKANMSEEELHRYFDYAYCPDEDCGWSGDYDYTFCPECGTGLKHNNH